MTIKQIKEWVKDYKNIYITGHVHPDGDCIGAALGLKGLLADHGIEATIMLETPPEVYSFLSHYDEIITENPAEVDVLFVVDCNDKSRFTPFLESYEKAKVVINIDHHEYPKYFITENRWIKPSASSTSEMIYDLFEGKEIRPEIAEALYTGIIFDTGGFMHSNTHESTMQAAGKLMATGINFGFIMKRLFHRQTVKKLMAKKIALDNLIFLGKEKIALTHISYQELKKYDLSKEDTEDVVHLVAQLEDIESAVFIAEFTEGEYKLSFRSKRNLDVCQVAKAFHGGGHIKAAGASSTLPLPELIQKIEKEILERL